MPSTTNPTNTVKVFTIPVGQGDSTLIECPNIGGFTLIDMGSTNAALNKIVYVKHVLAYTGNGANLRHIFLTHPDADHINYGYVNNAKPNNFDILNPPQIKNLLLPQLVEKRRNINIQTKIEVHIGNEAMWNPADESELV